MQKSENGGRYMKCLLILVFICSGFAVLRADLLSDNIKKLMTTKTCPKCYLVGAHFKGGDLSRANAAGANFGFATFENVDFDTAKLAGANFSNTTHTNAVFINADLSNADFTKATATHADFTRANLTNTNLTNANLRGAYFIRANLTGTIVKGANFFGSDLTEATWIDGTKCPEKTCGGKAWKS